MESSIKQNVMRRVRVINAVRPFTSPLTLSALVLVVSLYELGRLVFVAQVYRNMPAIEDVGAVLQFFVLAFLNTEFVVQIVTILVVLAVAFVARDVGKGILRVQAV